MNAQTLNERIRAAREETEGRGDTFYPGPSRTQLGAFPPRGLRDSEGDRAVAQHAGNQYPFPCK